MFLLLATIFSTHFDIPKQCAWASFLPNKQASKKYLPLRSYEILIYHRFLTSLQMSYWVNRRAMNFQTTKSSLYFQYIIEHAAMNTSHYSIQENGLIYFDLVLWWKDTCHRRENSVLNLVVHSVTSLLYIKVIIRFENLEYNIPLTLPISTYVYTITVRTWKSILQMLKIHFVCMVICLLQKFFLDIPSPSSLCPILLLIFITKLQKKSIRFFQLSLGLSSLSHHWNSFSQKSLWPIFCQGHL